MYRYLYLTTVLCANFLTVGCDQAINPTEQAGIFYISNNKPKPLEFYIDNNHFLISKGEVKKIILGNGEHELVDEEGKRNVFMVYPGNHGGIINPARDTYYSFTSIYASKENQNRFYLDTQVIWINGRIIKGAIASSDALFIDNNIFQCDIPLNTPNPLFLPNWKNTDVGNILTKCFSQPEFEQFLNNYPNGIHFYSVFELLKENVQQDNFNWINEKNSITEDFIPKFTHLKFKNHSLLKEAESINQIINRYLASRDPKEKQDFYNQYHAHIMKMAAIYRQQIQNNILEDKDAYLQLMKETNQIFDAGILGEPILI